MSTLVILPIEPQFSSNSSKLLAAAQQIKAPISVFIHQSMDTETYVQELSSIAGVTSIISMSYPEDAISLSKYLAQWITEQGFDTVFASNQHLARVTLPRIAALIGVGQLSNLSEIVSSKVFKHPIYAGNAIETVEVLDNVVIATVRCSAFSFAEINQQQNVTTSELAPLEATPSITNMKNVTAKPASHDLTTAKWVIGIGRGVNSEALYSELSDLAEQAGFALGGTRAVIDSGLMSNDKQIGQTGKIIAPDVYIALGVSGAIQHLAGILSAKKIIAVNNDADAPIMQIADIALVATVEQVMPQLKKALLS
ncbi:electron transfer flavoprotein subunit alpha/FixB family protein [Vibrio sp. MA40-2]|uniref:electron transfer flavoprotein subunit alpha/FixB family protein n=1 Tax=Vibrio sp. MA40-2 TaxID=3391828 RepID=UPI0039A4282E